MLYEFDSISKEVIEEQIMAPFDDCRVLTIKLEEFAKSPSAHLVKIAEFLQISEIAGVDLLATAANPDSGQWQNHFTPCLREVFKERYGQALIDLGYEKNLDW